MIVKFNESMETSFNHSHLNDSIIDIYIEPYLQTDSSKSNLTWHVKQFKSKHLEIELNFTTPSEISPGQSQDSIVFHIKNQGMKKFYAPAIENYLHTGSRTLESKIQRQLANNI